MRDKHYVLASFLCKNSRTQLWRPERHTDARRSPAVTTAATSAARGRRTEGRSSARPDRPERRGQRKAPQRPVGKRPPSHGSAVPPLLSGAPMHRRGARLLRPRTAPGASNSGTNPALQPIPPEGKSDFNPIRPKLRSIYSGRTIGPAAEQIKRAERSGCRYRTEAAPRGTVATRPRAAAAPAWRLSPPSPPSSRSTAASPSRRPPSSSWRSGERGRSPRRAPRSEPSSGSAVGAPAGRRRGTARPDAEGPPRTARLRGHLPRLPLTSGGSARPRAATPGVGAEPHLPAAAAGEPAATAPLRGGCADRRAGRAGAAARSAEGGLRAAPLLQQPAVTPPWRRSTAPGSGELRDRGRAVLVEACGSAPGERKGPEHQVSYTRLNCLLLGLISLYSSVVCKGANGTLSLHVFR